MTAALQGRSVFRLDPTPSVAGSPRLDAINRWTWAPPADEISWQLLRRSGRAVQLLQAWVETQICALVPLEPEREAALLEAHQPGPGETPEDAAYAATAAERLQRFKAAQFSLHVDEHFTRTKRQRDRIIYSMLRCRDRSRVEELALAIREGTSTSPPRRSVIRKAPKVPRGTHWPDLTRCGPSRAQQPPRAGQ